MAFTTLALIIVELCTFFISTGHEECHSQASKDARCWLAQVHEECRTGNDASWMPGTSSPPTPSLTVPQTSLPVPSELPPSTYQLTGEVPTLHSPCLGERCPSGRAPARGQNCWGLIHYKAYPWMTEGLSPSEDNSSVGKTHLMLGGRGERGTNVERILWNFRIATMHTEILKPSFPKKRDLD